MKISRYGVYWANLDPVQGREISKRRPAIVVSDHHMNAVLGTVVICPLTSRIHPQWPSRVQTRIEGKDAEIAVDQIRTVDKARLTKHICSIPPGKAAELRHIITLMYGVLSVD